MFIDVKNTTTDEEYKERKSFMEGYAMVCKCTHEEQDESIKDLDINKIFYDEVMVICIEYSNGQIYHYTIDGNDNVTWW